MTVSSLAVLLHANYTFKIYGDITLIIFRKIVEIERKLLEREECTKCNLEKEYHIFSREGTPLVSLAAVFVSSRNAPPEERCV